MILHLVRHAHAVTAGENPQRPLSARGRNQVAQLVACFRANGRLRPTEVWHSPLARSRETAALLAAGLDWTAPLIEVRGLKPEDDPGVIAARLTSAPEGLVIVGHEPHLGALATFLVRGTAEPSIFTLKKSSVLALEREEGHWQISWLIGPELIESAISGTPSNPP